MAKINIRHELRSFRFSWFFVGGGVLVILLGLFFDIWRTYAVKKSLESNVKSFAENAAGYLPYRPHEAIDYATREIEGKYGMKRDDPNVNVRVLNEGRRVEVEVVSDVAAYFAWMVGKSRLRFGARAVADVTIAGGGPVASLPRTEIAVAVKAVEEFALGQQFAFVPWSPDIPGYALPLFAINPSAGNEVRVGAIVDVIPLSSFADFSSPGVRKAAMLEFAGDGLSRAKVRGFAALDLRRVPGEEKLTGKFTTMRISGEPSADLPSSANFGLFQGGTPSVKVRLEQ